MVVPDFNDPACMEKRDDWYHHAEEQQEQAFEEALARLARDYPGEAQDPVTQEESQASVCHQAELEDLVKKRLREMHAIEEEVEQE